MSRDFTKGKMELKPLDLAVTNTPLDSSRTRLSTPDKLSLHKIPLVVLRVYLKKHGGSANEDYILYIWEIIVIYMMLCMQNF